MGLKRRALGTVAAFFFSLSSGHLIMKNPVPFGVSTLNNSPLNNAKPGSSDSDYPCKQRPGVYDMTAMNYMKVGDPQLLDFIGTASHGGGTCQIAVTLDEKPSANSTFKIIQVFEGGCPIDSDGNGETHPFTFTLPREFPNGVSTLTWVWYNRIGDREIYMNCAPITVSGGSNDLTYFDSLPNLYVINLPTTECESGVGSNAVKIPHPGQFYMQEASGQSLIAATGPSCSASAAAQTEGVMGYQSAVITTNGALYKAPSTNMDSTGAANSQATPASDLSTGGGGANATPKTPASSSASATSKPGPKVTPSKFDSTLTTTTTGKLSSPATAPLSSNKTISTATTLKSISKPASAPSGSIPTRSGVAKPSGSAAPSGGIVGSKPGGSQSCSTTDSALHCSTNGKQFALCANGLLVWQDVAPGTRCEKGQILRRREATLKERSSMWSRKALHP